MKKLLYFFCFMNSGIYGMEYDNQEIQKNINIVKYDSLPIDIHTIIKKYIPSQQSWYEKHCFQHEGVVRSLYLNENKKQLITQTANKISICDIKKNIIIDSLLIRQNNYITSTLLNRETTKIALAINDGSAYIYDIKNKKFLLKMPYMYFNNNLCEVKLTQFSTDETLLMTIANEKIISLWNTQLNEIKNQFFYDKIIKFAFLNEDGTKLIVCLEDTVIIWDIQNRKKIFKARHKNDFIATALLYNNEQQLITITTFGLLCKWNIAREKVEEFGTICNVSDAFFNTDQTKLIIWSDNKIVIHDVVTGKEIKRFNHNKYVPTIKNVCLNEEGFLAIAFDNKVKLLNSESGDCVAVIQHNNKTCNNWITSLCFNKKGTQLITSSFDKTTKIWKRYDYTINQIVLYNLLRTWMLLEKPDKNIKNIDVLLNTIAALLLEDKQNMHTIWLTFPKKVQDIIWNRIEKIIQQYGK